MSHRQRTGNDDRDAREDKETRAGKDERQERNQSTRRKTYLTPKEDARRQEIFRSLIYHKPTDPMNLKAISEVLLLIIYGHLEHRELVEDDMKELKAMIEQVANRAGEIIIKARGRPPQTPQ